MEQVFRGRAGVLAVEFTWLRALIRCLSWLEHRPTPKGCRFHSCSGHIRRLQVRPPFRECMEGDQSMFLSLPLSPSPFPSL